MPREAPAAWGWGSLVLPEGGMALTARPCPAVLMVPTVLREISAPMGALEGIYLL